METFSKILNAVKPGARNDRYKVLAALYSLNAFKTPVTTHQVQDLFASHFGKAVRMNTSDRLRKLQLLVRVADRNPPQKWLLTDEGVEELRGLSGLALPLESERESYLTDVGIVCALAHPEFGAVISATGGPSKWRPIGSARFSHLYRACEIPTDSGQQLSVVGTTSTSMGLTAASIVTTQLVMQFRPRLVVMIGIAAGTVDGNKQFGDILVADPSVDYNSGKVVRADGIRDFLPDPYPIGLNARLRSVIQKYRGNHEIFEHIRSGWSGSVPSARNRLHLGPLGAADQVVDDPTRVFEIKRNWRKLIGVEMETYGVYRACSEAPEPKPRFVSFKSVCDFAAEKSDSWQDYAAYTAAEFAMRFIRTEWDHLKPQL